MRELKFSNSIMSCRVLLVFSRLWGNWSRNSLTHFLYTSSEFSPDYEGIEVNAVSCSVIKENVFSRLWGNWSLWTKIKFCKFQQVFSRLWGNWSYFCFFCVFVVHFVFSRLWGNWRLYLLLQVQLILGFLPTMRELKLSNLFLSL